MPVGSNPGQPLLDAARRAAPEILGLRDETEQGRRLPPALVDTLRGEGLFHLWLPEALGGPELHPLECLAVLEELARAEGAVGWCAANASIFSLLAGSLDADAAREIFAGRAIMAGSVNPAGKAFEVDGGYRVAGRWTYGSGVTHSQWTLGNCILHDAAGPAGQPMARRRCGS